MADADISPVTGFGIVATIHTYPRVNSVEPLAGRRLLVRFANGEGRIYDCGPLLQEDSFAPLADEALFMQVRPDDHGYGVVWNDELDLAESELWSKGEPVEPRDRRSARAPRR